MKTLEVRLVNLGPEADKVDVRTTLRNASGFFAIDLISWLSQQLEGTFLLHLSSPDLSRNQLEALGRLAINARHGLPAQVIEVSIEFSEPSTTDTMLQQLRGGGTK